MDTYTAAMNWLEQGVSVIPIEFRDKRPDLNALRAVGSVETDEDGVEWPVWGTYRKRLPTERELWAWFCGPRRNLGVVTANGLVVIDFDTVEAYDAWLMMADVLGGQAAIVAANSFRVRTARGVHLYLYTNEPAQQFSIGIVDVKANGYVLAPPSVHPNGSTYSADKVDASICRVNRLQDVFPFERPEPEAAIVATTIDMLNDPYEAASRSASIEVGTVARVRARVSVESLVAHIQFHKHGRKLMGICPLHNDENPSFWIDPAQQTAGCYGCGFYGDVIDLYARLHGISNRDAIRELASIDNS